MKRYKILTLIFATVLFATACKKSWLDINTNPNNPESAPYNLTLPSAIGALGYTMGDQFQIWGNIWSQSWTQGPTAGQYKSWDRYVQSSTEMDRPWQQMYSDALTDLDNTIASASKKDATGNDRQDYVAVAKILRSYTYQVLTDAYGDIPYAESLKGVANLTPKYTSQEDVYKGIIASLNEAIIAIDAPTLVTHPGSDDLIFGGNMTLWYEFANTLRLKCYLRLSYIPSYSAFCQAGIDSCFSNGYFIGQGEDVQIKFYDKQFNANPLNTTIKALSVANIIASKSILDSLGGRADKRIDKFFAKATTGSAAGTHNGVKQGAGESLANPATLTHTNYSLPSYNVGGTGGESTTLTGKTAPVILMSAEESFLLQAEADLRFALGADAKTYYEDGIKAGFARWGLLAADATAYIAGPGAYPTTGTTAQKAEKIATEKWYSMCGTQGFEAWTEFRRTKYPSFLTPSASSQLGAGNYPARFVYPSVEATRNPNMPAGKSLLSKVWWDTK